MMTRYDQIRLIAEAIYNRRNGHGCIPWSMRGALHKRPYLDDAEAVLDALAASGMLVVPSEMLARVE